MAITPISLFQANIIDGANDANRNDFVLLAKDVQGEEHLYRSNEKGDVTDFTPVDGRVSLDGTNIPSDIQLPTLGDGTTLPAGIEKGRNAITINVEQGTVEKTKNYVKTSYPISKDTDNAQSIKILNDFYKEIGAKKEDVSYKVPIKISDSDIAAFKNGLRNNNPILIQDVNNDKIDDFKSVSTPSGYRVEDGRIKLLEGYVNVGVAVKAIKTFDANPLPVSGKQTEYFYVTNKNQTPKAYLDYVTERLVADGTANRKDIKIAASLQDLARLNPEHSDEILGTEKLPEGLKLKVGEPVQ